MQLPALSTKNALNTPNSEISLQVYLTHTGGQHPTVGGTKETEGGWWSNIYADSGLSLTRMVIFFLSHITNHCWVFRLYVAKKYPAFSHSINRNYTLRYPKSSWVFRGLSWAFQPVHDAFRPVFIGIPGVFRGSWAKNT